MSLEFQKFNNIEHMPLRVYNRAMFATNLMADSGREIVEEYFQAFTDSERKQIFVMLSYIKKFGQETAMKAVTKDMKTEYNNVEELTIVGE